MKKITIIVIIALFLITPIQAQEEGSNWELNPNASNSENYDSVSGSYKGYNFFSEENIKKSENYEEKEKANIEEIQNKVILEKPKEMKGYEELENLIWEEPIVINNVAIVREENYVLYYLVLGGIIAVFAILFSKEHYRRKRKRRMENDNN